MSGWASKTAMAAAGALVMTEAASAQTPQPPAAAKAEAVRAFEPAFFARYNPVTAFDLVRHVPGFAIDNGDALRGFGATAGNVLIDGQRPSSKNSISDELGRIAARDVARVELIGAAAAGDIDVRGYTELANVVLKPATQAQTSGTWRVDTGWQGERGAARAGGAQTWKTQDLGIRLNVQGAQQGSREETAIETRNAAGALTARRDEFSQQNFAELLINATLNWTPGPRDFVNLTGRLTPRLFQRNIGQISANPAGALSQLAADDYTEKDILHAELGGDWEHKFSGANSVKLVLVNRAVTWRPQELFERFTAAGAPDFAQQINSELKTGEHVARGVWTWKRDDTHTLETALEGAFNYLDQHRSLANSEAGGPFVAQVLPVATTRVEEVRVEASVNDTWRIDPKLTLELGFTYETSTITQTGDAAQERDFNYPKPRAVATWTPTKEDQIRVSVERTVAQLSFTEFASVVVPVQNLLTIGNPNLEPAQALELNAQWKRQIGQRGSISIGLFHHDIEDVQDFIPIRPISSAFCQANPNSAQCVFTAAGNIGDGSRWGGRIEATLPLEGVGVKGGILKFLGAARDSRVTDPITRQERRIANEATYDWNIDFRQDLPDLKIAWGGDYSSFGDSEAFRLNEEQVRTVGPGDLDLFIETTAIAGVTLRLGADNIGNQPRQLDRRFVTPNRFPGGAFSSSEFRESTSGAFYTMTASGSF